MTFVAMPILLMQQLPFIYYMLQIFPGFSCQCKLLIFFILNYAFWFHFQCQVLADATNFCLPGCLPKMCPISKIIASCKFIFCLTNVQTNSLVQHRFLFLSFNSCTSLFYMHIRVWKEVVTNIYIRKIQLLCCGHMEYGSQIGCGINYKALKFSHCCKPTEWKDVGFDFGDTW